MPIDRPITLVTGAGSGLGLESALSLAQKGYKVCGAVLTSDECAVLRHQACRRGVEVEIVEMDVTKEQQVHDVIDSFVSRWGRLDNVVQFAGLGLRGFFEDLALDEIRRVYDVNVFGLMAVTQAALPHMRLQRFGRIVLTTSIAGRMGAMSIGGYSSSKFAVEGLGECLRQEAALFGIAVSLLEPGLVQTPHFTVNRNRARKATNPSSPYYDWFYQHEQMVDRILARNKFGPQAVAREVIRILDAPRPRLRYVVGGKAKLIFALRRHIPGEIFEAIYWRYVRRLVTEPSANVLPLSGSDPGKTE